MDLLSAGEIQELLHLVLTQFSPEADDPQCPNDIMCCGQFTRCPLNDAFQIVERQQGQHEEQYPVIIAEGESLYFLNSIEMLFSRVIGKKGHRSHNLF